MSTIVKYKLLGESGRRVPFTETASGSHPCCVVSVTYDRTSSFHGDNN